MTKDYVVQFVTDEITYKKIKELYKKKNSNMGYFINEIVKEYLKNLDERNQES